MKASLPSMITWQPLGGNIYTGVSVVSRDSNSKSLHLFAQGPDFSLQHNFWNGTWSGWDSLGEGWSCSVKPTAVSWGGSRLDVFTIHQNTSTIHGAYNGTSWAWNDLGPQWVFAPSAVSWGVNRIDIFNIGDDNNPKHQSYDGSSWSGWESITGTFLSPR